MGAFTSLKVLLEGKNPENLKILRLFFKAKTEECNQKTLNVSDNFGTVIPCSAIYFLEVNAYVALKSSLKRQKNPEIQHFEAIFLKQKGKMRQKNLIFF